MKKIVNTAFIVVVLLCMALPFVFNNGVEERVSESENRMLAAMPLPWKVSGLSEYTVQFEEWIGDSARGRGRAVSLSNRLDVELFAEYPGNFIKGKDKHSFWGDEQRIASSTHRDVPDESRMLRIAEQLEEITQDFDQRGIAFFAEIIPAKNDIYQEYLPDTLLQVQPLSATEAMLSSLSGNTGFDFYSPLEQILEEKERRAVYYHVSDGNHWNYYGAYKGYQSIMTHAEGKLPGLKVLEIGEFDIVENTVDINFSGKFIDREQMDELVVRDKTAVRNDAWFETIGFQSRDPWKSYAYYTNSDQSLPKLIVVGDSFIWMFLHEMFAESFSEYVFIHSADAGNLNLVAGGLMPDLIVFTGTNNALEMALDEYAAEEDNHGATSQSPSRDDEQERAFSAQILWDDTPTEVTRGQSYTISIRVKNTGTEIWGENVKLCIFQEGQDYGYRNTILDGAVVKPGGEYTFVIVQFDPPPEGSGLYLEYQMVQDERHFFGNKKRVDIAVND